MGLCCALEEFAGGISSINIGPVSVTKRAREIGARTAIGAPHSDIRNQFLIEALALSVAGGIIGIVIGPVAGGAIALSFGLPLTFNPAPIALAFGVSALIGVAFGLHPAVRASPLGPIIALHTE